LDLLRNFGRIFHWWSFCKKRPQSIDCVRQSFLSESGTRISFPFRYAPSSSAPKCLRLPFPLVKAHTTNSCCGRDLIFNRSGERRPSR
jgi:hypothetical protein